MGNVFGNNFRVITFGESHGPAMGVVMDGCPSGVEIDEGLLRSELERDVPDKEIGTTREEPNHFEILSGLFEGRTLGTPIAVVIRNCDAQCGKYRTLESTPRPGHVDLAYRMRYEHVDWRGGSRSSGRECISRVAAGAFAKQLLNPFEITVSSQIIEMAGIPIESSQDFSMARERVLEIGATGDSSGGLIRITVSGMPTGVGAPIFNKLQADLAAALMSIGGIRSFEQGVGLSHARLRGSEANDAFCLDGNRIYCPTNNCGGIQGGITIGSDIVMTISVKPTPSISIPQKTVDIHRMEEVNLNNEGRYDYNFTPRTTVVAEAMTALVMVDHLIGSGYIHPVRFHDSPLFKLPKASAIVYASVKKTGSARCRHKKRIKR